MQNLDQIRAAKADTLCTPHHGRPEPDFYRNDVASIPALILTNGLLAAAAFCCEEGKEARAGMRAAFNGIASHLRERGLASVNEGSHLAADLARKDSLNLQRATAEALALLSYLKRFSEKNE
jgi:CRISPR/Cas system CMR-associated protein Cmr5 small subunit